MTRHTFMTLEEVAALMRWGRTTAYVRAAKGELPGTVRHGRSVRVHKPTFLASLQDHALGGALVGLDGPEALTSNDE